MSVYTEYYGEIYGGGGVAGLVLGLKAELYTGQWTDITDFVYQRDPVKIQLGRQDESSQISPASCSMTLNNRDGRFTTRNPVGAYYGTIGQNTPFRLSVPAYLAGQGTALLFADDSQSYVSCPDSDALQLTGDFDVRIDMWLDDYQPCTLAGKWGGDTDLQAWCLVLNGDGTVSLYWCSDGTVSFAQSTAPLPYLGRVMVRAFFAGGESDLVTVRFYTAPTMSGSQTQLGDPTWGVAATGFAQAAATQPVQAGYVDGFLGQGLPTGNSGCLGRVYELQLYNATPDLVADPVFSAQSAGATSFTDGESNTWTLEGTSALDDRCYRFHGEMSAWPKAADPSSRDAYSQATASGVLRRLNQGTTPVLSVMRRGIVSYIVPTWGVAAYWPCEDAQGSTQIASGLPGGTPMSFSGVPSFQGQPGSPSADSIFACSAQLVQPASSSWTGPVHGSSSLWGTFLLLAIPSGGLSGDVAALAVVSYSDGNSLTLGYTTADGGTLTLTMTNFGSVDGTTGVNGMGLLAEILTGSGDSTLNTLALGAAAGQSFEQGEAPSGSVTSVVINPAGVNLEGTEIGHVWVSADPPAIDSLADYLNAFSGETAAYRVARLCSENGLNSRIYGAPGISVPMGAQSIDTLANLFQYCEATDMGMLYEPRETAGMGYRTSASMCNQSPAVTADYSMQQVSQGFADTADDLLTLNDVIASNVDGSSAEQTLTAGRMSVLAPPDGIGPVSNTVDVYPQSDAQLPDLAGWTLHVRSVDEDRYPDIPFQMARSETPQGVPLLRIGDYAQITNTPYWVPPPPVKQLCAGFSETLGPGIIWPIDVNGVPESPYEVMTYDGSWHYDTAGSELASGVSSTATTLSVETTAGELWTTSAGDFPFNIMIAGEVIEVTDITGSSSPQSFTVVRSVNGVVKSQAEGAAVALASTPVYALTGAT